MNDSTNAINALEPALEALVDLCNKSAAMSNECAVITAEAALERVYRSRKDADDAELEMMRAAIRAEDAAALEKVRRAAPLLLDALEDLLIFDNGKPEFDAARAAIAAATN